MQRRGRVFFRGFEGRGESSLPAPITLATVPRLQEQVDESAEHAGKGNKEENERH
jgi:hypothetical protein